MVSETLSFNTVMMSNSLQTVMFAVVGYVVLTWLLDHASRAWLVRTQLVLPKRLFSKARHTQLRDAWTDIAIACFGLAAIGMQLQAAGWLIALASVGYLTALVLRAAGDCNLVDSRP